MVYKSLPLTFASRAFPSLARFLLPFGHDQTLGRLFVIKTRWEALAVIYALAWARSTAASTMSSAFPAIGGWLLFAACTGVVFMAGAKLLDLTRKDSGERRRKSDLRAVLSAGPAPARTVAAPTIGGFSQLAARPAVWRPASEENGGFPPKNRFGTALVTLGHRVHQGSREQDNGQLHQLHPHRHRRGRRARHLHRLRRAPPSAPPLRPIAAAAYAAVQVPASGQAAGLTRGRRPGSCPPPDAPRPPPKPLHPLGVIR